MAKTLIYVDGNTGNWGHADDLYVYLASDFDLEGLSYAVEPDRIDFAQAEGTPVDEHYGG